MDGSSLRRFNIQLALSLLLFFAVFALIWSLVVMPICDARDWKPPCRPRGTESMGGGI